MVGWPELGVVWHRKQSTLQHTFMKSTMNTNISGKIAPRDTRVVLPEALEVAPALFNRFESSEHPEAPKESERMEAVDVHTRPLPLDSQMCYRHALEWDPCALQTQIHAPEQHRRSNVEHKSHATQI